MKGTAAVSETGQHLYRGVLTSIRNWFPKNRAGKALMCAGGFLAIAVPLLYRMAVASLDTSEGSGGSKDLVKEPALLDSFSEASVACALLKQEANRLLLMYGEKRDQQKASQAPEMQERQTPAMRLDKTEFATSTARGRGLSEWQLPEAQSLLALDARIWELHLDLSRKALKVYLDRHCWNHFVDRYLQIVRESPERLEAHIYFVEGLDCAEKCGRTGEVIGAVQQTIKAHPELRSLDALNEALADWKAVHRPDPEVAKR
jgi:hypothetical protein